VRICCVVGGLSIAVQAVELRSRPDIIVATPGRLIDHLRNAQGFHLDDVEVLILDEADRLLELGFADEVKEICKSVPRQRQTMLFSATLTDEVNALVQLSLNEARRVQIDDPNAVVSTLTQEFVRIRSRNEHQRERIVLALCSRSFRQRCMVFCRSKNIAHRMTILFGLCGLRAAELHSNLTQAQRLEALRVFRARSVEFLICTDLASRGLDIPGVETVINMNTPRQYEQYVHRVGRTARAGQQGRSVTLIGDDSTERKLLKQVMKSNKGNQNNDVKSRVVPPAILEEYAIKIHAMEQDILAIHKQERLEKEARIAEMEATKAMNTIKHARAIHSRPARTWFQSNEEREQSKAAAARLSTTSDDIKTSKQRIVAAKKMEQAAIKLAKQAAKKKDPLKGLPRRKRRQKMMQLEAERDARRRLKEEERADPERFAAIRAAGRTPKTDIEMAHTSQLAFARMAKASRRVTKADLDGPDPGAAQSSKGLNKAQRKRKRERDNAERKGKVPAHAGYMNATDLAQTSMRDEDDYGGDSHAAKRFKVDHKRLKEKKEAQAKSKKNGADGKDFAKSKPGAFKSKKRYKRR
jgi:ATP-dependent RNA helicase DDX27